MNQRIFNPPLAKAGEPTPADAQATATVRIPNVTATGNQLSSLIRNLNELKTDDAEINNRIDIARAKIEELNDLFQSDILSAAFKSKENRRERKDDDVPEEDDGSINVVPSMRTIPTILIGQGGLVVGWAEITYGKVKKPDGYDATDEDDDLYHIYVRIFYDWAQTDIKYSPTQPGQNPQIEVEINGALFPVPSSRYVYFYGYSRSRRFDEYWNMWDATPLGGQDPNFYTEGFDRRYDPTPGADKTVNISMMLRGWSETHIEPIGESGDTVTYLETKMRPAGWIPIETQYGADKLRPGSPSPIINLYAYNAETVIFCTKQDLIEWNELAERHPDELYKIPLID